MNAILKEEQRTIQAKEADKEYNRKLDQRLAELEKYDEIATQGYNDFSSWITPKLVITLVAGLLLIAMLILI